MNSFDVIISLALLIALIFGFRAGLVRSLLTILGYVVAAPVAIWITSMFGSAPPSAMGGLLSQGSQGSQGSIVFGGAFLFSGVIIAGLLRRLADDLIGSDIPVADRMAGAMLGAARVGLVVMTIVLIFDRLVPAHAQPAYLAGSKLRPWFSQAAAAGLQSLPPQLSAQLDQLKRNARL
jgi:membrane protein required for colicin V production